MDTTRFVNNYSQRVWLKSGVKPRFCPKCRSAATVRLHRQGVLEMLVLLPVRPFRCMDCNRRFYGWLFNMHSVRSWFPFRRSNLS